MAASRRKSRKSSSVLVRVRVPEQLATTLDAHISSKRGTERSKRFSRSSLVTELLTGLLRELKAHPEEFGKLLVAEAVREAAEKLHYATVAEIRGRLPA